MKLSAILENYPRVRLAEPQDNGAILNFISNIQMKTKQGGLGIDRAPDFFALTKVQGAHSFTFLFLNSNGTIAGIACVSISQMQVQGKTQWLGYCSDLKFSKSIEPETRRQFYEFYENLIGHFAEIEELKGCRYATVSILDGNAAANKVLVNKATKKNQLHHRPLYGYENLSILAKLPWASSYNDFRIQWGGKFGENRIMEFLTSNLHGSEIVWSADEIKRRQKVTGFSFDDFIVETDAKGDIKACGILLSDSQYRRMRVKPLPRSLRLSQPFTSLLGQKTIKEDEPIEVGYLSFLKIKSSEAKERANTIAALLTEVFGVEKNRKQYHVINLQERADLGMGSKLLKKGYLCYGLRSTLYQVTAQSDQSYRLSQSQKPLDFDVVFH